MSTSLTDRTPTGAAAPPDLSTPRPGRQVAARRARLGLLLAALPLLLALLAAVLAPLLAPADPLAQDLGRRLVPPAWLPRGSLRNLLGTDELGRDILSRIVYGAQVSIPVALMASLLGASLGGLLGLMAGYYRGFLDSTITKLIDIQLSFPFVLFAIAVVAVAGPSLTNIVLVLAIGSWVTYARVVRSAALSLREKEFVEAARALGASNGRVLLRHLAPNVASLILVVATLDVGRIIILESTLGFLGLGLPPPTPTWGGMLSDARQFIAIAWWAVAFPGLAIMLVVLSINQLGDRLRDLIDPRLQA